MNDKSSLLIEILLYEKLCRRNANHRTRAREGSLRSDQTRAPLCRYVATEFDPKLSRYPSDQTSIPLGRYVATELEPELGRYVAMSVSLVSSVTSASSVLERDVGLSLTILDERSFEFGREVFRNSGFNIGEQGLVS
ncbi:hypothetical protein F2Q69_00046035 [Brassica cretica]|nr:hypothetical protein F2Q69_00046035 [Brassica cretica]